MIDSIAFVVQMTVLISWSNRRKGTACTGRPGDAATSTAPGQPINAGTPTSKPQHDHNELRPSYLCAVAVTGIPAITAFRRVLGITKVIVQLALQGALDHHLRQFPQQPALAGQLQPGRPGPLGELAQQLLVSRRQLRPVLARSCVTSVIRVSSVSAVTTLKLRPRIGSAGSSRFRNGA